MNATDELVKQNAAQNEHPARDEGARARAYLDLWERHLIASAVSGPILPVFHLPA